MRLWSLELIPHLPDKQLLGQHREVAALRGLGWGRKHATVDYAFSHSRGKLVAYHNLVMDEMERRGMKPDPVWRNPCYRGKRAEPDNEVELCDSRYPEHNAAYLVDCLANLARKGHTIRMG